MRLSNVRSAPQWITPDMVRRILELAMPVDGGPVPITPVATRGVKPSLAIVGPDDHDDYPSEVNDLGARSEGHEAERCPVASPLRRKKAAPGWTPEEDERLREAYAGGERIDHVAEELGRPYKGTISRAAKLGFSHPREIKGGFITKPKWSDEEDALLRALYGEAPTKELPARIGRSLRSIYQRAFDLDLKHGYQRQWTRSEVRALKVGHRRGLAVADVAHAMNRNAFAVSKYATNHGYQFGRRPLLAAPITLDEILILEDSSVPMPPVRDRLADERAAAEERKAERAWSVEQRRRQAEKRKEEVRRQRQASRLASRPAPQQKATREVEKAAVRQAAVPAPSREPAPLPQARAHPLPARPVSRALGMAAYAERMRAAVELLRGRHFVVRRYNPEEVIGRWQVTGQHGLLSNEELVELAIRHGLELAL